MITCYSNFLRWVKAAPANLTMDAHNILIQTLSLHARARSEEHKVYKIIIFIATVYLGRSFVFAGFAAKTWGSNLKTARLIKPLIQFAGIQQLTMLAHTFDTAIF